METPVANLGNIYEPIPQMLAREVWPRPKGDTGRQWSFVGKSTDSEINLTGLYAWIYQLAQVLGGLYTPLWPAT